MYTIDISYQLPQFCYRSYLCGLCPSSDINRLFPDFNAFIKVILKKEKLSEEAELYRARYEGIIKGMEEDDPPPRPASLIGDDDSGYHSTKPKGVYPSNACHERDVCVGQVFVMGVYIL